GALDAFGATVGAVYLRDPEHPVLRLAGARSKNAGDAPAWAAEVAWGKGVAGGAAAAGEPLTGVEHDRSTLAAPLLLGDDAIGAPLRAWRIDDAGRVALLCAFAGDAEALARELYFTGDLRERCGALRGLAMFGRSPVAVDSVLDACRTSSMELFEAATADNP